MAKTSFERTQDIYEGNGVYPPASQIPIMELTTDHVCKSLNIKKTRFSQSVLATLGLLSGFNRFYKKELPKRLDTLLKTQNLRGAGLQAPAISASLAFLDDPRITDPLDRAVTLMLSTKELYDDLQYGRFEPDRFRDTPLEMGQYPNLFGTTLTVENKRARLFKTSRTDQMAVLIKGLIYIVKIDAWDAPDIYALLKGTLASIVENSRQHSDVTEIGLATSASHGVQVFGFTRSQADARNRQNLETLRHNFLVVCLDFDVAPEHDNDLLVHMHARNLENRWSWQSLQIVVFKNAKAGVVCNFSAYLDGNTMMRGASELQRRASRTQINSTANNEKPFSYELLQWNINPKFLQRARTNVERFLDRQPSTYEIPLDRNRFKRLKLDPVATFVTTLSMVAERHTSTPAALHQFLTMTKYRYMDLTTAVVSTPEVRAFAHYSKQEKPDAHTALELLQRAIQSQKDICRWNRHALPFEIAHALFIASRSPAQRIWVHPFTLLARLILIAGRYQRGGRRDIVISHPAIYPEVPLVGRPGVRLPYVTYFALHYQIMETKIIITMMPGLQWSIPNEELIREVQDTLYAILDMAETATTQDNEQNK